MSGRGPWVLHRFRIGYGTLLLLYLNKKYVLGEGVSPSSTPFFKHSFCSFAIFWVFGFCQFEVGAWYFFCVCPWSVIATPTNHRWWPSLHSSTKKDNLRTAEWVSFKLLFFHIFLLLRDFFGYFCEYIWNDLNNFYLLLGISIALTRRAKPCIRKGIIHLEKKTENLWFCNAYDCFPKALR